MNVHVIILSGGSGSRMGLEIPKQFLQIRGRGILSYSVELFLLRESTKTLTIVAHPDHMKQTIDIVEMTQKGILESVDLTHGDEISTLKKGREIPVRFVRGGASRHSSTLNGIQTIKEDIHPGDIVLIHDAARPSVTEAELDRLISLFENDTVQLASLAMPVSDTMVMVQHSSNKDLVKVGEVLNRDLVYSIKTPQAFRADILEKLLDVKETLSLTDLLSWGEAAGVPGYLALASPANIKLTTPDDIPFIEKFLPE